MVTYPRPVLPRLQFSGRFFADPSTINNDISHFENASFRPNYQLRGDASNANGRNPVGTGAFALVDCTVNAVKTSGGTHVDTEPGRFDPLLRAPIVGNDQSVQAKIVDLDPQMQMVSQIWGLRINIGTDDTGFKGLFETTPFRDLWGNLEGATGMPSLSAVYQGVLKLSSLSAGRSPFLTECSPYVEDSKNVLDANGNPIYRNGALSVRFILSGYNPNFQDETFRYGTVTGIIQPWLVGEPMHFDSGRILYPQPSLPAMQSYAYLQADSNGSSSLYIDLANSLRRTDATTFKDIGVLYAVTIPNADIDANRDALELLGEIDYLSRDWLKRTGGIAEIPLSAQQKASVESTSLAVVVMKDTELTVLLLESKDGYFSRADDFVYRLNPAERVPCEIFVTKFGQRVPNATVSVGLDSSTMQRSGPPLAGVPASGLNLNDSTPNDSTPNDFITKLRTDAKGVAALPIEGGDAKNARGYIDGQVYGIRYGVGDTLPPIRPNARGSDIICVLLFDKYNIPQNPSWIVDVLPIFKQYANLYPSMDRIVSLDDYGSCVNRVTALTRAFGAPVDDPHYMPVTRDLSRAKRDMILQWLTSLDKKGAPLYMNIDRKADLLAALQTSIELEHATIPPYLCALYSIKQGYNQFVSDAIRDVVMEEMLHFALACNILIAIGGKPEINKIGFVPKYPGPLPGGLRRGLIVRLRKCSIEQLKMFMAIEAPEKQTVQDDNAVDIGDAIQLNKYTIGFLYNQISKSLERLHKNGTIKFPDDLPDGENSENLRFQVYEGWLGPGDLTKITNLDAALCAIRVIKEQGEGAAPAIPVDGTLDPITGLLELSHYFRFAEIVEGRRLVLQEGGGFSYTGERIELDEDGIYNMQDNPNLTSMPEDSQERDRMESFSRKYQAMLNGLHITFNGQPDYLMQAVALMFQLTISAEPLMKMPAINADGTVKSDGTTVGISFQVPFSD